MLIILASIIHLISPLSLPLHNGIYSASGSYTATIQVGTPPRRFQVQIDTGSNKLAVPCVGCSTCHIQNALFDYSTSSTYSSIPCISKSATCDDCQISAFGENVCLLNITFYDNSSILGRFVNEAFSVEGLAQPIQTKLGCILQQNSDMASFGVEGIWGVARGFIDRNGTAHRTDQLIAELSEAEGSKQRIVGLCLATVGGWMNIGKMDEQLHTQPGVTIPYDNQADTISNSLGSISVGRFIVTNNGSFELPELIIDSGSTVSFVSRSIYDQISKGIGTYCGQIGRSCKSVMQGETQCFYLLIPLLAYIRFPPIELDFKGSKVLWHAEEYLTVSYANRSLLCFTFAAKEREGGFILGNDFMLNKDVVFGESGIRIYPKSKCSGSQIQYRFNPYKKRFLTSEETQKSFQ